MPFQVSQVCVCVPACVSVSFRSQIGNFVIGGKMIGNAPIFPRQFGQFALIPVREQKCASIKSNSIDK